MGDKLQQHVTGTNCFVCTGEFLWKSLSPQQNFVSARSLTKSNQTEFVWLVALTKFCFWGKDFHKNSPLHAKQYLSLWLSCDLLQQLVSWPEHMEWFVTLTCCSDMMPSAVTYKVLTWKWGKFKPQRKINGCHSFFFPHN